MAKSDDTKSDDTIGNERLLSIDVFRGIAITAMILVNNPGSWSHIYAPLKHAVWHGWTPTDMIFPFFLFIVGVSAALSGARQQNTDKLDRLKAGAVRSLKLFGLGLFIALFWYDFYGSDYNWWSDRVENVRIMGVLQRIGLVYLFALPAIIWLGWRGQLIYAVALLLIYQMLMYFVAYPDPSGEIFHNMWAAGHNVAAWLDYQIIGASHIWQTAPLPYGVEPEGLLTSLPATVTVISGALVGRLLLSDAAKRAQVIGFLFGGFGLVVVGQFISQWIPINKALWTGSYVLLSSGFAVVTLALLIWVLDVKGYKRWSHPLVVFGANAIGLFVISALIARLVIMIKINGVSIKSIAFEFVQAFGVSATNASLFYAVLYLGLLYGLFHWLYRHQIIWKV